MTTENFCPRCKNYVEEEHQCVPDKPIPVARHKPQKWPESKLRGPDPKVKPRKPRKGEHDTEQLSLFGKKDK